MKTRVEPGQDWTVVLRRQPARIVAGQAEGGYTDAFEIICCDCGDHPDRDYRRGLTRASAGPRVIPDRGRHCIVCEARRAVPPVGTCPQHGTVTDVGWPEMNTEFFALTSSRR